MACATGAPLGEYVAIIGSTAAGAYNVSLTMGGNPLGNDIEVDLVPGLPDLQNIVLQFSQAGALVAAATAGDNVTAVLAATDAYGNWLDLRTYLKVRTGPVLPHRTLCLYYFACK